MCLPKKRYKTRLSSFLIPSCSDVHSEGSLSKPMSMRERIATAGILALSTALLSAWTSTLPGLHGDEAWVLLRSAEIQAGERPLSGMNYYTGALHQYLVALISVVGGPSIPSSRLLSGATNMLALLAMMNIVRRLHPGQSTWLWTGLFTGTSIPFVLFSRFATEITSLSPCLIYGGLFFIQRGFQERTRAAFLLTGIGAILLGLSVYNHMAAAGTVAGVYAGLVLFLGGRFFRDARGYILVLGGIVGLFPRVVQIIFLPGTSFGPVDGLMQNLVSGSLEEVLSLPFILLGMLDGGILFQRFTGATTLPVLPIFSGVLVLFCVLHLFMGFRIPKRSDVALIFGVLVALIMTTIISPRLSLRYFHAEALVLTYMAARMGVSLMARSQRSRKRPGIVKGLHALTLFAMLTVAASQIVYVAVNYFYTIHSVGAQTSVFPIGLRLKETSNHFIRTDGLYEQLVSRGVRTVAADGLIILPLRYYDRKVRQLHLLSLDDASTKNELAKQSAGKAAFVFYNGPTAYGVDQVVDRRDATSVRVENRKFLLAHGFEPKFLVFLYPPDTGEPRLRRTR